MKGHTFLRLTLAALLFTAMTAVSVSAQTIPAEDDTWTTGSGTQVDFANFGNINLGQLLGSSPTSTVVNFAGTPLNSSLGQADTLVARGSATVSDSFSSTLSLKGSASVPARISHSRTAGSTTSQSRWPRRAAAARWISRAPVPTAGLSIPALWSRRSLR